MKFTYMIYTSFSIIRLFFNEVSVIFNTLLPRQGKTLYTNVVNFLLNSEHITNGTRKLQTNCDNASVEFIQTETRKTPFSFTTMPSLTPACSHVRQSQKCDRLFFPILLTA
jgi:hypothetical protein